MTSDSHETLITGENKYIRVYLYLSFILIGVVNTFLGPTLPFLYEKWRLNDVQAGYLLAAQGLGGLLGTWLASFLYVRFSSKGILAGGYILIIVSMFGLSSEVWSVGLFSSFLSGIALGVIIPTTTLVCSRIAGENRAAAINLLNFFWALGAVLSPMFSLALNSPERTNYFFTAIALAGLCFTALLLKLKKVRVASSAEKPSAGAREKICVLFSARLLVLTVFLQIGIESSLGGWLPTFVKRITFSDWWLLIPSLYWMGFLSSRLLSVIYLKKIGENQVILYGSLLIVGGQTLFLSTNRLDVYSVAAFTVGFAAAPIFPTTIAALSGEFERKAPELLGYMFTLAGLSGMFFSWLIGYFASATGDLKNALLIPLLCGATLFTLYLIVKTSVRRNR